MSYEDRYPDVSVLKGKTLESVLNLDDEELIFTTTDGHTYKLYHSQDCCESVYIEDIAGDLSDLVGSPLLEAEEVSSQDGFQEPEPDYYESSTWTYYKFGTIKGHVNIRWFGSSNGYYSEGVSFVKIA